MGVINLGILIRKLSHVFLRKDDAATELSTLGFVTNTDYAQQSTGGVVKVNAPTYGTAVGSTGLLQCAVKDATNYETANVACFMSKGTIENMKDDITARALVAIAASQHATPTAGTYTVKLTYDGAAWGVTIIQDT